VISSNGSFGAMASALTSRRTLLLAAAQPIRKLVRLFLEADPAQQRRATSAPSRESRRPCAERLTF
jgi:hypothetical protein